MKLKTIKSRIWIAASALAVAVSLTPAKPAMAQTPCIGEIMIFGGTFCPRTWADTEGQLLAINTHSALFSLLGTMYGGDGRTTFGLPDLRGRSPVSEGAGPGLSPWSQGEKGGAEYIQLSTATMPSHSHNVVSATEMENTQNPSNNLLASLAGLYQTNTTASRVQINSSLLGNTGGGQQLYKRTPSQTIRYCIALEGLFCGRN